jgi:hypothetical protein
MMLTHSNLGGRVAPTDNSVAALPALMEELEASLLGSQQALLALDLAGIEQRTSEQAGLMKKFDAMRRQSRDGTQGFPTPSAGLEKELRLSGTRILEAARLQSALLARAQSKLRVMANMLADPSVDYGRLLARQVGGWDRSSEIWK